LQGVREQPSLPGGGDPLETIGQKGVDEAVIVCRRRVIGEAETAKVGMAQRGDGNRGHHRHLLLNHVGGSGLGSIAAAIVPLVLRADLDVGFEDGVNILNPPVPAIVIE